MTGLADQMVTVFADAATRDASWTNLNEGVICWLIDPGRLESYDGSSWRAILAEPGSPSRESRFGWIPPRIGEFRSGGVWPPGCWMLDGYMAERIAGRI